jgi:hypothetical protein
MTINALASILFFFLVFILFSGAPLWPSQTTLGALLGTMGPRSWGPLWGPPRLFLGPSGVLPGRPLGQSQAPLCPGSLGDLETLRDPGNFGGPTSFGNLRTPGGPGTHGGLMTLGFHGTLGAHDLLVALEHFRAQESLGA